MNYGVMWVSCMVKSLIHTPHQIFGWWNQEEWDGWCIYHILGEKIHVYMVLVVKTKGKRPLGKPVLGLKGNMKTDLKEIRWEDMDWIYLAENVDNWQALINVTVELLVSYIAANFLITWGITMLACQARLCSIWLSSWINCRFVKSIGSLNRKGKKMSIITSAKMLTKCWQGNAILKSIWRNQSL